MMLQYARFLASRGFRVFPLIPESKKPLIEDFPRRASTDPAVLRVWWETEPRNIGISTDNLLAVDVDVHKGGDATVFQLELEGYSLPPTYTQATARGGRHYLYTVTNPVSNTVEKLGPGVDTRGRGGYVVAAGSVLPIGEYTVVDERLAVPAPQWLIDMVGAPLPQEAPALSSLLESSPSAFHRAELLLTSAPAAIQGERGDLTTYRMACRLKDLGLNELDTLELMAKLWNPRCVPPWPLEELTKKVRNAFDYGKRNPGEDSPEAAFSVLPVPQKPPGKEQDKSVDEILGAIPEAENPIAMLNREYGVVTAGGGTHVLWETTDHEGNFRLEHLSITSFLAKTQSKTLQIGKASKSLGEIWLRHRDRREWDGLAFSPGKEIPARFYNLWRGFAFTPLPEEAVTPEAAEAVNAYDRHLLENACRGDDRKYQYLVRWLAHLIQRPWEKPLVALVLRSEGKGTGKNTIADRVGALLGPHYLTVANRRYLTGNFNAHLEYCSLLVLDEAFWSGDKSAQGILQDLVTGNHHMIEHKGVNPYKVRNFVRVILLSNAEWVVPASADERRYLVLDVGEGAKQKRRFFHDMRVGMERGGYQLLLHRLQNPKLLEDFDVNGPPLTDALHEQKVESLEPFHQWWFDSLVDGRLLYCDVITEGWPRVVEKARVHQSFRRYVRDRNIRTRLPNDHVFRKQLLSLSPGIETGSGRVSADFGGGTVSVYRFPELGICREQWEAFIGHKVNWEAM